MECGLLVPARRTATPGHVAARGMGSAGSPGGSFLFIPFVIKQYPHRRCIGIVVLPGPVRPEKGGQKNKCDEHAASDQKEDDTHDVLVSWSRLAYRCVATVVKLMIVTVLNGINTAANSGDRVPVTANPSPMIL